MHAWLLLLSSIPFLKVPLARCNTHDAWLIHIPLIGREEEKKDATRMDDRSDLVDFDLFEHQSALFHSRARAKDDGRGGCAASQDMGSMRFSRLSAAAGLLVVLYLQSVLYKVLIRINQSINLSE